MMQVFPKISGGCISGVWLFPLKASDVDFFTPQTLVTVHELKYWISAILKAQLLNDTVDNPLKSTKSSFKRSGGATFSETVFGVVGG